MRATFTSNAPTKPSRRRSALRAALAFGVVGILGIYATATLITYTLLAASADDARGSADGAAMSDSFAAAAAEDTHARVLFTGVRPAEPIAPEPSAPERRHAPASSTASRVSAAAASAATAAAAPTPQPRPEHAASDACVDEERACRRWARDGECELNPGFMRRACRRACYACESPECHDVDPSCAVWGAAECDANPGFMLKSCPFTCGTCGFTVDERCARLADDPPAIRAGEIDALFRRLSAPGSPHRTRILSSDPWVLAFDDFLSDDEVEAIVAKGGHNFERSLAGDGVTPVRTSSTSWCNVDSCLRDPTVQRVRERISEMLGIPWQNAEHLQILRYDPGQFYKPHHDQNALAESSWGVRLFTFYMYLSDVEDGGQTRFNNLGIEMQPRRGSAVLWPSVLDADPDLTDNRTFHEAVPPRSGQKLGANFWIHQHRFQEYHARGCDNKRYFHPHHRRTRRPVQADP